MTAKELAAKIAEHVIGQRDITFAHLANCWPEHFENGDCNFILHGDGYDNIVVWANMSECACDALDILRSDNRFELRPTSVWTYAFDGSGLSLPIATRKHEYKDPHWLPSVIAVKKQDAYVKIKSRPSPNRKSPTP